MSNIWGAYLEDYNYIKLIIPINTKYNLLYLEHDKLRIPLVIDRYDSYGNELYLHLNYDGDILLHEDYYVVVNDEYKCHLNLGKITRSKRFDVDNYYDGHLGFEYSKDKTTFNIWTPVAKEVIIVVNEIRHKLNYINRGLWTITINQDLDKASYYYLVRINEAFVKVLDPYAISSSSNHEFNYVINLDNTYQLENSYYKLKDNNYINSIIYEINIRDINGNVRNEESLYLKSIDKITYFKDLGITHLQLMPVFGFGGVNEEVKDNNNSKFKYNWGYNPVQYMIPSGWYASNPDDPYARINEFKQMIDSIHRNNLGVNLDVVFNHVYQSELFSLGLLVPGYVYRTDFSGFMMNSSYCGNDIRTEALMNRKFIIDTLVFFQQFYKIDGFRFDLMGLIDNDTIIDAKRKLEFINPSVMLYGEGWYMNTDLPMNLNANLGSANILKPVAYFNDYYRNRLSGKLHEGNGFILGDFISNDELTDLLNEGSIKTMPFVDKSQSINYIECHDNYTFFDKVKYLYKCNDIKKCKDYCKFGLGLVLLSQGIPFIHSGSELMRSKAGNDNSYNLFDNINHFPWENRNSIYDLTKYVIDLIKIRKTISGERRSKIIYNDNHYEFRISSSKYQVIIKNNYEQEHIYFAPMTYLIFNNEEIVNEKCESLKIDSPGIWILKK